MTDGAGLENERKKTNDASCSNFFFPFGKMSYIKQKEAWFCHKICLPRILQQWFPWVVRPDLAEIIPYTVKDENENPVQAPGGPHGFWGMSWHGIALPRQRTVAGSSSCQLEVPAGRVKPTELTFDGCGTVTQCSSWHSSPWPPRPRACLQISEKMSSWVPSWGSWEPWSDRCYGPDTGEKGRWPDSSNAVRRRIDRVPISCTSLTLPL